MNKKFHYRKIKKRKFDSNQGNFLHATNTCSTPLVTIFFFKFVLGGIVCIVARMESLSNLDKYKDSFFPLCDDLEKAGKWTKIECSPCPYWNRIQGVQLVYRVC